ncbi:ribosomal protein L7/L12 C-terminal domain-containing protein [Pyronema domesticum]|uniref:Similar to 54S ribosomal protein L12, mitochondrial acc. no. P53163 n=1 Tax=Pyronema omphalodes (strain CBS 100304) TaxID=1076935 RepID=U4LBK2_PYROM|nr:ribosomal protein L7/L12 C-terminal domain-containing protein [Pyronema domesticum]CCX07692.1 Similar to 54S ribosomal protein L12, mitochondrial; acc. no. P53163 [Pyronema omphalodes CBS 100304]
MSLASRCCARLARATRPTTFTPLSALPARRFNSTDAAVDPKISAIVDQISQLTLLQTAELVSSLKSRLNIPDMALQSFAAAPAAAGGAAPAAVEEAEEEVVQEKTMFNVKLVSFDAGSKPKIIKEVKSLLGLSLVDSKKFVESVPKMLKEGLSKEDSEKIQKTLQDLGAKVDLE